VIHGVDRNRQIDRETVTHAMVHLALLWYYRFDNPVRVRPGPVIFFYAIYLCPMILSEMQEFNQQPYGFDLSICTYFTF
jgi:hypothetical protein